MYGLANFLSVFWLVAIELRWLLEDFVELQFCGKWMDGCYVRRNILNFYQVFFYILKHKWSLTRYASLLLTLTREDQCSLIPYIKPAHEHMNKNSTGRVRLKAVLKISLSCLSGYIKEKWPHVQRENWHGRLHCDLAERWRRYNYFYFLFSSQINSMASPWDEK